LLFGVAECLIGGISLNGGRRSAANVLLLLPELGYLIPWDWKIDEFAEVLKPPGVSAFTPDGRSASARDGRPDGVGRNADGFRKLILGENGGREHYVPYARGTGRALPRLRDSPRNPG
jgi:hypothetical protein